MELPARLPIKKEGAIMKKVFCDVVRLLVLLTISATIPSLSLAGIEYSVTDLGEGKAFDINSSGQVVGYSGLWIYQNAFLWEDGVMTILGTGCARGINDSAQVVGCSAGTAVLWENGTMVNIDIEGLSCAYDINNSGQIVGDYKHNNYEKSFILRDGNVTDLGSLGGETHVGGINDSCQVAGGSKTDPNDTYPTHAFLWEDDVMTNLGIIESYSYANDINNICQVVGNSSRYAFLWENDIMSTLGSGHAYGINDLGQVVGDSLSGKAVLWKNGETIFLQDVVDAEPDFILKTAFAINNNGQIVGYGRMGDEDHAFLLTPIFYPGDFDEDGDVDGSDLAIFVAGYGTSYDEDDLSAFAEEFGRTDCLEK
jgi:probable HAF family extracellular repeat protein